MLIKDADGPPPPLWQRLLGDSGERALGAAKELLLPYGFELSYPVTVLEYLLCCWYGGVDSVAQGGGDRAHPLQEFTAAHAGRLLLNWPLYVRARWRLNRALAPYYRSGRELRRRQSWLFADAAMTEMVFKREQALREVRRQHPWLNRPVVNVTWENAYRYCCWLSQMTGQRCRLPTELEFLRAVCYLQRECGWDLPAVFGHNWYWTADWYAELPSYAAGQTPARLPLRTTRDPFCTLKSVHLSPYERDGVVPWMRAANHGLLYVCERQAGGTRTDIQGGMMSILGDCLWRSDWTQVSDCTREYLAEPVYLVLPWGVWLLLTLIILSLFWLGFWMLYYRAMAKIFGDKYAGLKPFDWIGGRSGDAVRFAGRLLRRRRWERSRKGNHRRSNGADTV